VAVDYEEFAESEQAFGDCPYERWNRFSSGKVLPRTNPTSLVWTESYQPVPKHCWRGEFGVLIQSQPMHMICSGES
jgi:hypothetical protein